MSSSYETTAEWLRAHPPPDGAWRRTVREVAHRVRGGETLSFAVRELLDEFALLPRADLRARALAEAPVGTGDERHDARASPGTTKRAPEGALRRRR